MWMQNCGLDGLDCVRSIGLVLSEFDQLVKAFHTLTAVD